MAYNKIKLWLYKEGNKCTSVTGGWTGKQLYSYYPEGNGHYVENATYLEYGDDDIYNGMGGFITNSAINFSKFSTIVLDHQIVSYENVYNEYTGVAYSGLVLGDSADLDLYTPYGDDPNYVELEGMRIENKVARTTVTADISSNNNSCYIAVYGSADAYSNYKIICRMHNLYLESDDAIIINSTADNKVNFSLNNLGGLISFSKVEVLINNAVVQTYTSGLDSNIEYAIPDDEQMTKNIVLKATYTQGDDISDEADIEFTVSKDMSSLGGFNNGIDENTIFCLRGDSYNDLSFVPKNVTNVNTSIVTSNSKFGKAIQLGSATADNCIRSTDGFSVDPTSDMTFEWWEYSLGGSSNASIFSNRLTVTTSSTMMNCIMFGYQGTKMCLGGASSTSWDINKYEVKDKENNTWVHWALVKQGRKYTTYKNGVQFATTSATLDFGKTEGDSFTIGAWVDATAVRCGYNALIEDFKISKVARYESNFTPVNRPSTSINITDIEEIDNTITCDIYKGSDLESINRVDIVINDQIVESKTQNINLGLNTIEYTINPKEQLRVGENTIEVRVYYYDDFYLTKYYTKKQPVILETVEPLQRLDSNATMADILARITEINTVNNLIFTNLKTILSSKGIETQETRLSQLVEEINKQFDVYSEAEEKYLILEEKENVNRQKLVDLMLENGYSVTGTEEMEELLELLKESNINPYKIEKIFCGHSATFIIYNTGEVYGAGSNGYGSLGLGDTNAKLSFTLIPNMTDVKQIAGGYQHTVILKNDGTVWTSGYNAQGQLGLGNTTNKTTFTKTSITDVKQIACGENFTFAVKNDGSLWACGLNETSQLGLNDYTNKTSFTQVTTNISNDVKEVFCGFNHTFILKNDGSVYACGFNTNGALGLDNTSTKTTFTKVTTNISDVKSFACGENHTIMLKNDGSVWATGGSYNGQLGLGTSGNYNDMYTFTKVSTNINNDVKQIAAGYQSSLIIKNDGSLWGCGRNDGILGQNDTTDQSYFTKVTININDDVKSMAYCNIHAAILKNNGAVFVAGRGDDGQLGVGSNSTYQTVYIPIPSPK